MKDQTMENCPKCRKPIPADAPDSVCPSCLLDEALTIGEMDQDHGSEVSGAGRIGDLVLVEEIARGGMGVVYRAYQEKLNRMVAVKMIQAGRFAQQADHDRFQAEAQAVAKLRHPGIVSIHQVGEEDGNHFFSMDLVEGGDLDDWLDGRPMEDAEAARLVRKIAEAVQYAHDEGIVHRDLKPRNILMDAEGNPHVTDFGIAKRLDGDSQLTVTGVVMGSPSYMSPEQAEGDGGKVRETSDVYSLGAILYTLLTGRPPHQAASPMKTVEQVISRDPIPPKVLNPSISQDLNIICLKCLNKAPQSRYQSAGELIEDLNRFCAGKPILARPIGRTEKALKWARRNPLASGLCVAVVAVALIGFLSVWWQLRQTRAALATAQELRRAEKSARAASLSPRSVLQHGKEALSVAFASNGKELLTGSSDGAWRVFRVSDGSLLRSTNAHGGMVADAAFDSDDQRILSYSYDSQTHYPSLRPNGERVQTYSSHSYGDQSAKLWDARTGETLLTITNRTQMTVARLSPDGEWIAVAAWDGMVEIYETATGKMRGRRQAHQGSIQGLEFSPDSKSLVTASEGHVYNKVLSPSGGGGSSSSLSEEFLGHVLDVPSATIRLSIPNQARRGAFGLGGLGNLGNSRCTARFSPDGSRIVTAGQEPENTALWDAATGGLIARLDGHAHSVYLAAFSADGNWVATGGADNAAMIWDARTGERWTTLKGHDGPVMWVEFSPDSRLLATASGDGSARIWDVEEGVCVSVLKGHTKKVYQARFSPDGLRVATVSLDGDACLWDAASMDHLSRVFKGHDGAVFGMEFSRDSDRIATRSRDGFVRVWALGEDEPLRILKGIPEIEDDDLRRSFVDEALFARFTPDGSSVVALAEESRAEISITPLLGIGAVELDAPYAALRSWDLDSGKVQWAFPGEDKAIASVDLSADGQLLAAGQHDVLRTKTVERTSLGSRSSGSSKRTTGPTSVWIWNLSTGKQVRQLEEHSGRIEIVRFSPDGRRLISSDSKATQLWDLGSGRLVWRLDDVRSAGDCSFLPDGKRVMLRSPGWSGIWSLESGENLVRFAIDGSHRGFQQCRLSPDGQLAACHKSGSVVYLCVSDSGEVVSKLSGHRGRITDMAFHPEGKFLAASSEDKTVTVWRVATGELIRTLEGHKESVRSVVFSPDGKWLGSTSGDFTARLWPVGAF